MRGEMFYRFLFASFMISPAILAQVQPAFEVASIKPVDLDERLRSRSMHLGMKFDGARADFGAVSLRELLQYGFRVNSFQIVGGGDLEPRFDVLAKIPFGATADDAPAMVQQLLVERFGLTFHWDRKEFPVYALVVDPKGSKLRPRSPDFDREANRALPLEQHLASMRLDRFASEVAYFLDKPLVDQTGMQGEYLVPSGRMAGLLEQRSRAMTAAHDSGQAFVPDYSSVLALLADLGLKAESRKMPFPVLVIEKLEKSPTEQ